MEKIQVFIITHNRPELVLNSIDSVLNQTYNNIELIVSDNSSNNRTKELLDQNNIKNLLYIKRSIVFGPIDHLNCILSEVTANYFMIFHDDDTMYPNMVETLYKSIIKDNSIIAFGANAKVVVKGEFLKNNYNSNLKTDIKISRRDEMVQRYLKYDMVPFPSYLYRLEVAKKIKFNLNNGGKYCDAAFIIDLLSIGNIGFVASPLMVYYFHAGQGSNSFNDKIKLINYYTKNTKINKRHPLIIRFRIQNIFVELKQNLLNNEHCIYSKRNTKLLLIIFRASTFEYFPRIVFFLLCNKFSRFNKH